MLEKERKTCKSLLVKLEDFSFIIVFSNNRKFNCLDFQIKLIIINLIIQHFKYLS